MLSTETDRDRRLSPGVKGQEEAEGGEGKNSRARSSSSSSSSEYSVHTDTCAQASTVYNSLVMLFMDLTSSESGFAHLDLLLSGGSWLNVGRGEEE